MFRVPDRLVLLAWLASLLFVTVGSLLPAHELRTLHYDAIPLNDKVIHSLSYMVVASLSMLAFRYPSGLIGAALMIPFGIMIEFAQRLVPGRSFEIGDMVADAVGVFASILLAYADTRFFVARSPKDQSII
jgi:VanZ family protein